MEVNIVNTPRFDPILGSTQKMLQTTNTLWRLAQLDDTLTQSNFMRSKAIKTIQEIGIKAQEQLISGDLEDVKLTMTTSLNQISFGLKQNKSIAKIYANQIEAAKNSKDLKKCISNLLKDSTSLATFNLRKSDKGQNGPTHIVGYSRSSKKYEQPQHREYVVKWTDWNEVCTWRLYDALSQSLTLHSFDVPKAAALDFDAKLHEIGDQKIKLEDSTAAYLKQTFLNIVNKSNYPKDSLMILMEKVNGSNLIDFAKRKYHLLQPEEKQILFDKMGRLAMLDLFTGNTDRLIKTSYDAVTKQYQCENLHSNLGNVMIVWNPNTKKYPDLYAIDNGILPQLIDDEEKKSAYKQLLQNYLEDSKMITSLADLIMVSMENALAFDAESSTEDGKSTMAQNLKDFKPLLDDLKDLEYLKAALINGLNEMLMTLKEKLPSFWGSGQALEIKNYLTESHPTLLDAVSERFEIFNHKG